MKNKKLWVIVPARSGSKGLKDKNIRPFLDLPLMIHSINFAKKLKFVEKIFLSTDSEKYSNLGKKHGAYVPFLRSKRSSMSRSMEESVLEDIRVNLLRKKIEPPENILWLRPTHPLRDLNLFNKAYNKFKIEKKSVCVVTRADPRIFYSKNQCLVPSLSDFKKRSMVRRQDTKNAFRMFHGEFFKFPRKFNRLFLGKKISFVVQNDLCKIDIDTIDQLKLGEKSILLNIKKYEKFLHRA